MRPVNFDTRFTHKVYRFGHHPKKGINKLNAYPLCTLMLYGILAVEVIKLKNS
jgi:hypothetical protein